MPQVFIDAVGQKETDASPAQGAQEVISALLQQAGVRAGRVHEVHWLAEKAFELSSAFEGQPRALPAFFWPAGGLADHFVLQSAARAVLLGARDLILIGQTQEEHVAALLLASAAAVGRYNLMPAARVEDIFSLCGGAVEAAAALHKKQQAWLKPAKAQSQPNEEVDEDEPPALEAVDWLASAEVVEPETLRTAFPNARRLLALPPAPKGCLFLLSALLRALQSSRTKRGLILAQDERGIALATLIERV